jgi:hypothetical protein
MSNGKIDDAQVEVILSGGQEAVNRYVVTTLQQVVECVEETPNAIETAICAQKARCAAENKRAIRALCAALGAVIGLATPYVIAAIS